MKQRIRSVIVEDESKSTSALLRLLTIHCPQVNVVGDAKTVKEAIEIISSVKPDLVFMDIALPDGDGFEILERTNSLFEVIFTTAYDQYAIKAFEFSALHYLLKPVNHVELEKAIHRFVNLKNEIGFTDRLSVLKENLKSDKKKLILPTTNGYNIVNINEVVRLEASHNYTYCYLISNEKYLVSKPLCNFESILEERAFVRVHNKHLINLKYIKRYVKGQGGYLIMTDGSEINVAKMRKIEFIDKLKTFAQHF